MPASLPRTAKRAPKTRKSLEKVKSNRKMVAQLSEQRKQEQLENEYQVYYTAKIRREVKERHDESLRSQKFAREFDLLVGKQVEWVSDRQFFEFIEKMQMAPKVNNYKASDYKLGHELWTWLKPHE